MNHLVSDLIIRIKNAALAHRKQVYLPYSKISKSIAQLLAKEGFLISVAEDMVDGIKMIKVEVAYQRRTPVLTAVTITSRPSLRLYVTVDDIKKRARRGYKTFILTTSKGIMTGKEAIKEGIGGELLFEIQ